MDAKSIVVIGVGNTLLSDEGIGVHLLRRLMKHARDFPAMEFIESGSALMPIVHAIAGRDKAIIMDCAYMGQEPGTLRRFLCNDVVSIKDLPGLSLHEGDVMGALALSESLGEKPKDVVLFGVEPVSLKPGDELSDTLQDRLPEYEKAVLQELQKSPGHNHA